MSEGGPFLTGPMAGFDDTAVAVMVRALHDRGLPRDFAGVAAVVHLHPFRELERLCATHHELFTIGELLHRLDSVEHHPDEAYEALGLGEDDLRRVRLLALAWADDIRLRRVDDGDAEHDEFGERD